MAIIIIKLLHHVQDCGDDNGFRMVVVPHSSDATTSGQSSPSGSQVITGRY